MQTLQMKAIDVREAIEKANFKMNGYAKAYFDNLRTSEVMYGEEGLRSQIRYFLCNIRAMTPEQKALKKSLLEMTK